MLNTKWCRNIVTWQSVGNLAEKKTCFTKLLDDLDDIDDDDDYVDDNDDDNDDDDGDDGYDVDVDADVDVDVDDDDDDDDDEHHGYDARRRQWICTVTPTKQIYTFLKKT